MISGAEASRIGRALQSVAAWTEEIIVVLNEEVSDGTEEIAAGRGAKVFREPWKGHIAQKNSAAAKASQPWRLGLDADEEVSPRLRDSICRCVTEARLSETYAAFKFPRLTYFSGRWIRHGDWYPDYSTRLWRKGQAEWGGVDPHDKLQVRGQIGKLEGDLLHYNAETLDGQIRKIMAFSADFARHEAFRQRGGWGTIAFRPAWRFFRSYFLRLGFLDGWQGCYIAWMTAFYTATRYAKVLEAQTAKPLPAGERPASVKSAATS